MLIITKSYCGACKCKLFIPHFVGLFHGSVLYFESNSYKFQCYIERQIVIENVSFISVKTLNLFLRLSSDTLLFFCLALKPKIARSKEFAALSKKFVMVTVEVRKIFCIKMNLFTFLLASLTQFLKLYSEALIIRSTLGLNQR